MRVSASSATTSFGAPQRSHARAGSPGSRARRVSQWVQRKLALGTGSFAVFAAQDDTTSFGPLEIPIVRRVDDDLLAFADERRHEHGHAVLELGRLVRRRR